MRLAAVLHDIPWRLRLGLGVAELLGAKVPIARVMSHRPALFGEPFMALGQATLRGDSAWTVYERELFAGFCASVEACPY